MNLRRYAINIGLGLLLSTGVAYASPPGQSQQDTTKPRPRLKDSVEGTKNQGRGNGKSRLATLETNYEKLKDLPSKLENLSKQYDVLNKETLGKFYDNKAEELARDHAELPQYVSNMDLACAEKTAFHDRFGEKGEIYTDETSNIMVDPDLKPEERTVAIELLDNEYNRLETAMNENKENCDVATTELETKVKEFRAQIREQVKALAETNMSRTEQQLREIVRDEYNEQGELPNSYTLPEPPKVERKFKIGPTIGYEWHGASVLSLGGEARYEFDNQVLLTINMKAYVGGSARSNDTTTPKDLVETERPNGNINESRTTIREFTDSKYDVGIGVGAGYNFKPDTNWNIPLTLGLDLNLGTATDTKVSSTTNQLFDASGNPIRDAKTVTGTEEEERAYNGVAIKLRSGVCYKSACLNLELGLDTNKMSDNPLMPGFGFTYLF
tara:strand:+ start:107922 stop:109244 length:1323 start_codon:yes stop_codon:yes gene_type:complete